MDDETFEAYAEEFLSLLAQIPTDGDASAASFSDARSPLLLLNQAQDVLRSMAVHGRSVDTATDRSILLDRVKVYQSQWQSAKLQFNRQELLRIPPTTALRNERPSSSSPHGASSTASAIDTATTSSLMAQQNATLARATLSIQQTEAMALDVTNHLVEQRDTLDHATASAQSVQSLTASAHQMANTLLKPWWRKGGF